MIRIAAVGDIHVGVDSAGRLRPHFESLSDRADVLLLSLPPADFAWRSPPPCR